MISFSEAQRLIHESAQALPVESVPIAAALHRVLAAEVKSKETIPPFANSAMDGFAVRFEDVASANAQDPVTLPIIGTTAAGDVPAFVNSPQKTAWRIMTGAAIPEGYDTVYPIETVQVDNNEITLRHINDKGLHIRAMGEDFSLGEPFVETAHRINAGTIAALASCGIAHVSVYETPKVLHFATGSELVEDASESLKPGQIRNSNAPFLQAALQSMQVNAIYGGQVRDEPDVFLAYLREQISHHKPHVILTTGAVSAGDFDFIPQVIKALGGEIIFHKTTIKPGKPILFAKLPNGVFFFGLPGNPVSTAVGLRFFVSPLLRQLQDLERETFSTAVLDEPLRKGKSDWRFFIKAKVMSDAHGVNHIAAHGGQESHKVKPLIDANAWLILDEGRTEFNVGDKVLHAPFLDFA